MSREEFRVLFDNYFNAVRSYLFYRGADKEQASDLAQDVFLRIWEKQPNMDPKTALGFLYKMAGDMFISRYRRATLELNYKGSLKADAFDTSPEDQLQYKELYENFNKALTALHEKQRTVFLMARIEGLTYHEIAERLGLSVKAIEKRMSVALAYLKKELQE